MLDITDALTLLNAKLKLAGKSYVFYICGGAALNLLGYDSRMTDDVDVLMDYVEKGLNDIVEEVASELGLNPTWLNAQVYPLVQSFPKNWQAQSDMVLDLSNLRVFSVERQLLINTKLRAAVNRQEEDSEDLIWLKPSLKELKKAKAYVLENGFLGPIEVIDAEIKYILAGSE
jgi:hypothetical protein